MCEQGERMERNFRFNTQLILNFLEKHNMSKKKFCELCGINTYNLECMFKQKQNISPVPVFKVIDTLFVKTDEFLVRLEK